MEEQHKSKIVWVLFIIIVALVGLNIYQYYLANNLEVNTEVAVVETSATPTTSATASVSATPTATATTTTEWKVYTNDKYGFTVTLDDNWQGYFVEQTQNNPSNYTAYFRFWIPTSDANYSVRMPGYFDPFVISVYTKDQWANYPSNTPKSTYIGENNNYVIAFSTMNGLPPEDLRNTITLTEVNKIKEKIIIK